MRGGWAALLLLGAAGAEAGVDFSGKWALDPTRSVGVPLGLEQAMVVEQHGDTLSVATTLIADAIDRVTNDVYTLGAGELDVPAQMPGVTAKTSKRSARWTGERTFDVSDHVEGEGPNGPVTLDIVRHWEIATDRQTLTIEQAVTNSGFTTNSTRVFAPGGPRGAAAPRTSHAFPVDLSVPVPPTAFRAAGKTNLVYELHLTSFRLGDVEWKRLDVLADDGRQLASFAGKELEGLLTRPGVPGGKDTRRIAGGMRAVAFLWLAIDGAPPPRIRHRVAFDIPASASGGERVVEGPLLDVRPVPLVIGPPVRGEAWVVRWISNTSFHRRALLVGDGQAKISQRFAIDWNRYSADGRELLGEGKENKDYSVYGEAVIAVADGVVAKVVDSIPENEPGSMNPAVPVGIETAAGNSVSLRIADRAYALYGHLQPGSIQVKEGQHVRRGELIARVGNSGNATGPHLHFQLSGAPGLDGEGLPYVFDSFEVLGAEDGDGKWAVKASAPELRQDEMPPEHAVLRFGESRR